MSLDYSITGEFPWNESNLAIIISAVGSIVMIALASIQYPFSGRLLQVAAIANLAVQVAVVVRYSEGVLLFDFLFLTAVLAKSIFSWLVGASFVASAVD